MAKEKMIEAFIKGDEFTIQRCKVKWAMVQADRPDTKYEHCWKCNIILDEEWKDNLLKSGFKVHQDKDGDWVLVVKRKCKTRDGKTQSPPKVVGIDGRTKVEDAVGNGSLCNIIVYAKYQTVNSKTTLQAYLNAIQVLDLVPYEGGGGFKDETEAPF